MVGFSVSRNKGETYVDSELANLKPVENAGRGA